MDVQLVLPILIVSIIVIIIIFLVVVGIVLIIMRNSNSKGIKSEVNVDLIKRIEILEEEIKDINSQIKDN
ncbi:hypothetical protein [Paucisalibacillus globulus]|uniref:hypothetical protein n=1 Tax=Paucisalibacillus globulus TaxID=351095 RepID=UPI000BB96F26|nr:hypothetical protein [Paucisalibacillus globulus]